MKTARRETINDGRGVVIRFSVGEETKDFPVKNYTSGKVIKEAAAEWAAQHGAILEP